jgi:HK97 family phage portal protein
MMAKRDKRRRSTEQIPLSYQDTPEQIWRRWETMHGSKGHLPTTLDAIRQSSWVYSAVTFICEHFMRTPQTVWRGDRRAEMPPDLRRFIERPNAYSDQNTSSKFRYAYLMELLLHGAVMRLLGGLEGFKPQTQVVRPRWQFTPDWRYDEHGRMVPLTWTLSRLGTNVKFVPEDTIFHDALYNPLHDFEGLAPLTAALLSVSNDTSINEFADRFFQNDGSTGLVFSTDHPQFNQKQADDAAKKWKESYSGLRNAFGVKFVGFGLQPFNVGNPLDAKMLQILRSFTKEEIVSGIYKVPLDAISAKDGGGDIVIGGPSGGTQASAREAFLVNVVQPWAMRYDEEFNRDITWRFDASLEVRHDFTTNPILERRRLERAQAAVELIDRGVPLNEVIRWLKLEIEPQPHGDDYWVRMPTIPARIVLAAGQDAFKIAAPDRVPLPGVPPADKKKQSQDDYVAQIVALASQKLFAEGVRHDEGIRVRGNGQTNRQRLVDLLTSGNNGRLPPWDADGGTGPVRTAVGEI